MQGIRSTLLTLTLATCAAGLLAGCGLFGQKRQSATFDNAQSQLYSEDQSKANSAAMVLISSENESAYRVLRAGLAEGNSATTRSAVIRAYMEANNSAIKGEALAALSDKNEMVVQLAKNYIIKVVGENAGPELLAIARDGRRPETACVAALNALGRTGWAPSVEGLIDVLDSSTGEVADAASAALREITYQPLENDVETWRIWYSANRRLTREQWRRLGSAQYKQVEEYKSQVVAAEAGAAASEREAIAAWKRVVDLAVELKRYEIVVDVLAQARPADAQVYAIDVLGKARFSQARQQIKEKLNSSYASVKEAATSALGLIGNPEDKDVIEPGLSATDIAMKIASIKTFALLSPKDLSPVVQLINDPSSEVRITAARAFGSSRWAGGVEPLLDLLARDGRETIEVRIAAVEALGDIGDKSASPTLVTLTKDADSKLRYSAVRSLTKMADPSFYEAFLEATFDQSSGVREAAVVGLAKIGDKRAVDRIMAMVQSDVDPKVAEVAWAALVSLVENDADVVISISRQLPFAKAEELLKKLADSNATVPQVVLARKTLAKAYLDKGNYPAARVYYQMVLDQNPNDPEALAGITIAMRNTDDLRGLATIYARQIADGTATEETKSYFLSVLSKLLEGGNHADVVRSSEQVLARAVGDEAFVRSLRDIQAKAVPPYHKSLVTALGNGDESARRAARDALAGYGRTAAAALVEGLRDASGTVRAACLAILVPLADGKNFDYDPTKPPDEQQAALSQWQAWAAVMGSSR